MFKIITLTREMQIKTRSYQYTLTKIAEINNTDMTILSIRQDVKQLKLSLLMEIASGNVQ